jgi:hypothetical protein
VKDNVRVEKRADFKILKGQEHRILDLFLNMSKQSRFSGLAGADDRNIFGARKILSDDRFESSLYIHFIPAIIPDIYILAGLFLLSSRFNIQTTPCLNNPPTPAQARHLSRDLGLARLKKSHMHEMVAHSQRLTYDLFPYIPEIAAHPYGSEGSKFENFSLNLRPSL